MAERAVLEEVPCEAAFAVEVLELAEEGAVAVALVEELAAELPEELSLCSSASSRLSARRRAPAIHCIAA